MKTKEYTMLPLFEKFIRDSLKGRRLKPDGTLMKKRSVENYMAVMKLLVAYEKEKQTTIRIKAFFGINTRLFMQEKKILGTVLPGL
jgi:hypothetical protein